MRTFFIRLIFILFLTKGYTQNENTPDHQSNRKTGERENGTWTYDKSEISLI